jgi:hypothetical protein
VRGNSFVELLEWLGRLGRPGGAVLLLVALVPVGASYALSSQALPTDPHTQVVFYSPALWLLAGFFGLSGLWLLVTGGSAWRRDARFKPMDDRTLADALARTAAPFFVCCDCRVVLPFEAAVGRCPRCNSAGSCLEVSNAQERTTALNALGLEAPPEVELEGLTREFLKMARVFGSEGQSYADKRIEGVKQRFPGHDTRWYLEWLIDDLRRARR